MVVATGCATHARARAGAKQRNQRGFTETEVQRYRFFVHREQSAYRLVLRDDGRLPDGTSESEWQLTRLRDGGDVNADVVGEIAARG